MQPQIVISKITKGDVDEIIELGLKTKELQVHSGSEPIYYSKNQLLDFIKSPNDIYLVAKINGKIAGYRLATFNQYLHEAYLIDISVKKEYRGLGVGKLLYKKTMEELQKRNCDWCWALVYEENNNMNDFIEKQGFVRGKKFNFYYKLRPFI